NTLADYNFDTDILDSTFYTIPGAGDVQTFVEFVDGRYLIEFIITPLVTSYYWRFTTSGSGHFDIWAAEATTGFSNYVTTGLPPEATFPEIINYQLPNTEQSTVSSWQCSDKVITVGSYSNRDTMTNYYGVIPPILDVVGELFISSSRGPTRDGRIKPDICAPGARVLSTAAAILTDWLIEEGAATYMSVDGQHYLYNGTSFSSPAVAGIAALYLQKNPTADYAEIKDAIISHARKDIFTGDALPDNDWGYGKADAFRALTGDWGCSADNYSNPPENIHLINATSTKAKIGWDLIPNALGYQIFYKKIGDPQSKIKSTTNFKTLTGLTPASTYTCKLRAYCAGYGLSNWSSDFIFNTLPLRIGEDNNALISIYPNPATNNLYIDGIEGNATATFYNLLGEIILFARMDGIENSIDISSFSNGIFQVLINDEDEIYTQKIMVIK
ncbi:MAG: S8 family serine peptidase, partial [Chitinophagales bacterium]